MEEKLIKSKAPDFLMIKCVGKIRILLLTVQQYADFSILQTIYPYFAPMEELARILKVWIFPNFCHYPRILASQQLHAPGFSVVGFSLPWVRILTGTTLFATSATFCIQRISLHCSCVTFKLSTFCFSAVAMCNTVIKPLILNFISIQVSRSSFEHLKHWHWTEMMLNRSKI